MPLNPEDEDGVVPDMHAAFGIAQAMERTGRATHTETWTDFGLEELARGVGRVSLNTSKRGVRREGKRSALLSMR